VFNDWESFRHFVPLHPIHNTVICRYISTQGKITKHGWEEMGVWWKCGNVEIRAFIRICNVSVSSLSSRLMQLMKLWQKEMYLR
jgi:hypothetical protein